MIVKVPTSSADLPAPGMPLMRISRATSVRYLRHPEWDRSAGAAEAKEELLVAVVLQPVE